MTLRVGEAARRAASIPPAYVLAPLVLAQWAMTSVLALSTTHNGWLYYHGGDGTYYWTTTWSLAHQHVPQTIISYGLPVAMWPFGLIFGVNMLMGLPAVIAFQVLLLAPLGVLAMYGLAARIGGRLFGYAAALAWILAPVVALWFFDKGPTPYRAKLHEFVLPNALGLTTIADYTSMILALVATYLVVRALDDRRWNDVILAGLTTGTLIAVKPSNGYYVIAPLLAFAICRRWREGVAFVALIVPALITLLIWKKIGLGYVPAASPPSTTIAASADGIVPIPSALDRYVRFDWQTFQGNIDGLRYVGRSFWLLEWLVIGGLAGLIRRMPAYGIAIGAWFACYFIFKGGAAGLSSVNSTSFFRLVMPAFPAFVLLALSIVFLLPGVPRRAPITATPVPPTRLTVVAVLTLVVYPLVMVATARGWSAGHVAYAPKANLLVPISNDLRATAVVKDGTVKLSWRRPDHRSSRIHFVVFRSAGADCVERASGARDCVLDTTPGGYTDHAEFVDRRPATEGTTYRIGLLAGWDGTLENADLLLVGPPVLIGPVAADGSSASP